MRRGTFIAAGAAATLAPRIARAQFTGPVLQQLTIGVSVPLSGELVGFGKDVVRGVQAAVDETNRFTISLKQSFGVRSFDDQNNGQIAVTNAQIAQADPSIIGMVGNLTAPVTLTALPAYANANFAIVVPTVTADVITSRGYRNIYRLPTKDSTEGQLVARTLLPQHAGVTAVALTTDGSYGPDVAQGFVQYAKTERHNATVVTLDANHIDPAAAAKACLALSPTHIFLAGKPTDLGPVAEALRLEGYTGAFSASDGFYGQVTIDKYAKLLNGVSVASAMPPLDRIPSIFQLLRDFEGEVGSVNAFSAYGYAAAQLIIFASQRSGATTRFTLLNTIQEQPSGFTTIVGQYSFNFNGDAILANIYFYTIGKDGFTFDRAAIPTGFVV
ncbi:MAG: branched-chain amino acid ABC transporter substrate-binding protein [Vulcanimicrobiaceae bacterium]